LTETNALGTTTNTFNLDQELTSTQDADGRVRDFVYNNDQQLTAENWMSGSTVVATMAYGYDLAGELTAASDSNSAYAFAYNGDGLVTSVDNNGTPNVPHVVLTNTYDPVGDRLTQSATIAGTADFLNSYRYNNDQELTTVTQQGQNGGNVISPKEIDYAYNAIGQFTDVWDYNTLSGPRMNVLHGAFSYDNGARLTGLAYTSNGGATTIDTFGWAYNAGNLVTSFTSSDGTASYGYDPTNQLTSATYTTASGGHQPANESYSFDLNGNRNSTGYSTGSDNLISSDGTFNYQHDADGNMTVRTRISNNYASDYRTTYTWDYRNRLTDVEYYDNNAVLTKHVHYVYDIFNDLIGEEDDDTGSGSYGVIQWYVVSASPVAPSASRPTADLAQPLLQFDGNQNLTERNLVGLDPTGRPAVMAQEAVPSLTQGGPVTWTADDNLGTSRDLVDDNGALLNHTVYASIGQVAYQSNSTVTFWSGFAGGHFSLGTGLTEDDLRWVDTDTLRFLSFDPSGFGGRDTNLTRVVGNNPANLVDPTGENPLIIGAVILVYFFWPDTANAPGPGDNTYPPPSNPPPPVAPAPSTPPPNTVVWPKTPSGQPAAGPPQVVPNPPPPPPPAPYSTMPVPGGHLVNVPAAPADPPWYYNPQSARPAGTVFVPNPPPPGAAPPSQIGAAPAVAPEGDQESREAGKEAGKGIIEGIHGEMENKEQTEQSMQQRIQEAQEVEVPF
jgi:RHS repeat-associated protein